MGVIITAYCGTWKVYMGQACPSFGRLRKNPGFPDNAGEDVAEKSQYHPSGLSRPTPVVLRNISIIKDIRLFFIIDGRPPVYGSPFATVRTVF